MGTRGRARLLRTRTQRRFEEEKRGPFLSLSLSLERELNLRGPAFRGRETERGRTFGELATRFRETLLRKDRTVFCLEETRTLGGRGPDQTQGVPHRAGRRGRRS